MEPSREPPPISRIHREDRNRVSCTKCRWFLSRFIRKGQVKVEVKTGTRRTRHVDKFGVVGDRLQNTCELWVDGVCFYNDCNSPEEARALVVRMSYALGLA